MNNNIADRDNTIRGLNQRLVNLTSENDNLKTQI
jgi:hypothetical protein